MNSVRVARRGSALSHMETAGAESVFNEGFLFPRQPFPTHGNVSTKMKRGLLRERLTSLDAFRGFTIAGMILVNNPGNWDSIYPPLRHAEWHGWTPTDLVFPFFLFIVGVAMTFSFARRLETGTKRQLYKKVLWRSLIIFALGLFLVNFPDFEVDQLKITGVLQRIALVYLLTSVLVLNTGTSMQTVALGGLLLGYWGVLMWVPVPGFGSGVLTVDGNLAAYLDNLVIPGRLYHGGWDAEGLLSTIPACATCLMGYLTGCWLRSGRDRQEIAAWLFTAGWGAILLGQLWGIWFPINKGIWTSSYAVFTAGAAMEFLALCYWLVDVKDYGKWFAPAVVFGMNAIAVYCLSEMLTSVLFACRIGTPGSSESLYTRLYEVLFLSWAGPINASLAFALAYVFFWYLGMFLLYRRRIFIRI